MTSSKKAQKQENNAEKQHKKKPPTPASFKPGQSGNLNGRPYLKDTIAEALRFRLSRAPGDRPEPRTRLEIIAEDMIKKAEAGESRELKLLFDRAYGQAPQTIKQTVESIDQTSDPVERKRIADEMKELLGPIAIEQDDLAHDS